MNLLIREISWNRREVNNVSGMRFQDEGHYEERNRQECPTPVSFLNSGILVTAVSCLSFNRFGETMIRQAFD